MQGNTLWSSNVSNTNARQSLTFTRIASKVDLSSSAENLSTSNTQPNASLRNLPYRERQRIYKQRYRTKQQTFQDGLEEANKQLHEEIKQLQVRLQSPHCTTTSSSTMWTVATEYFRLFQRGLHTQYETPRAQLDFLQAMTAPDISAGTVQSVATIVRNWVVFTRFFQDIDMQLQHLKKIDDCTLLATATVTITLFRHSLANLFPHLFYGGVVRGIQGTESRVYRIAKKLIDQRLVLSGSVHFDWNHSSRRVERIDSEFDLMTPLLQLLGSAEDVSFVLNGGLITPSFNVIAAVCPELEKHTVNIMQL